MSPGATIKVNALLTVVTGVLFTFFAFASHRWIDGREEVESNLAVRISSLEKTIEVNSERLSRIEAWLDRLDRKIDAATK